MAYIVGICWGNCTKLSYLMCPHGGIKCPHLILESFSSKISGPKNVVFKYAILLLYCKYLQIGTRYRRLENGIANYGHFLTSLPNFAADSMGLSSLKFFWWSPKNASFLQGCVSTIQDHPRSMILAPIESAYLLVRHSNIYIPSWTVCKIRRLIAEDCKFFLPHIHSAPSLRSVCYHWKFAMKLTITKFFLIPGSGRLWDSDGDGRAGCSSLAYERRRR